ncbi:hypothetical protein [Flagellimonas sp.]|uniref:hypothetical protein n=1 Tax=Flagellimonas sp. TaxID=2058762 RepID=UPI003B5A71C8
MEKFKSEKIKFLKKGILTSTIFCLLAGGVNAQESDLLAFNTNLENQNYGKSTPKRNGDYLLKVSQLGHSHQLSALQQRVTNFDISQLEEYDAEEPSIYTVVFREKNSSVYAKYNALGNLMSTIERHTNVKVPQALGREIAIQYPGWSFKNSTLTIKYNKKRKVNIAFKVQILNGDKKRVLKLPV